MDNFDIAQKPGVQRQLDETFPNSIAGAGQNTQANFGDETMAGLMCPNCGTRLEGRKCKLLCPRPGCGYLVTCSEW